jgi:glutamine synthetase
VDNYAKQINIEALAAIDMYKRQYLPASMEYATFLADSVSSLQSAGTGASVQQDLLKQMDGLLTSSFSGAATLESAMKKAQAIDETVRKAECFRDEVVIAMQALRADVDRMERLVPKDMWPVPGYTELLFML